MYFPLLFLQILLMFFSVCTGVVDLHKSLRVLYKTALAIFSAIVFPIGSTVGFSIFEITFLAEF